MSTFNQMERLDIRIQKIYITVMTAGNDADARSVRKFILKITRAGARECLYVTEITVDLRVPEQS